jgi:hypothetical protein
MHHESEQEIGAQGDAPGFGTAWRWADAPLPIEIADRVGEPNPGRVDVTLGDASHIRAAKSTSGSYLA